MFEINCEKTDFLFVLKKVQITLTVHPCLTRQFLASMSECVYAPRYALYLTCFEGERDKIFSLLFKKKRGQPFDKKKVKNIKQSF